MTTNGTLIQRAPGWYLIAWLLLLVFVGFIAFTRPWYLGIGVMVGFLLISWMVGRGVFRRAVWVMPDEVIVVNGKETVAVPRRNTTVDVVAAESSFLVARRREQAEWDNTVTKRRLLFLTHHAEPRERVQVEAALGLTPPRFDALVETLRGATSV